MIEILEVREILILPIKPISDFRNSEEYILYVFQENEFVAIYCGNVYKNTGNQYIEWYGITEYIIAKHMCQWVI